MTRATLILINPGDLPVPQTYTHVVVRHRPEYLPVIETARASLFGDRKPADMLVGVETLSWPQYLTEVDAIAVVGG